MEAALSFSFFDPFVSCSALKTTPSVVGFYHGYSLKKGKNTSKQNKRTQLVAYLGRGPCAMAPLWFANNA